MGVRRGKSSKLSRWGPAVGTGSVGGDQGRENSTYQTSNITPLGLAPTKMGTSVQV